MKTDYFPDAHFYLINCLMEACLIYLWDGQYGVLLSP